MSTLINDQNHPEFVKTMFLLTGLYCILQWSINLCGQLCTLAFSLCISVHHRCNSMQTNCKKQTASYASDWKCHPQIIVWQVLWLHEKKCFQVTKSYEDTVFSAKFCKLLPKDGIVTDFRLSKTRNLVHCVHEPSPVPFHSWKSSKACLNQSQSSLI